MRTEPPAFADAPPVHAAEPVGPLPDDPSATLRLSVAMAMVGLGVSVGVPMPELLDLAGVTPEQLRDPDAEVPVRHVIRLLQRIEQAEPDRPISLEMIAMAPAAVFGLVDLAGQSAATVGDAMEIYLRYSRLTSSHFRGWVERGEDRVAYRCCHLASVEALRHPVEIAIGLAHRCFQRCGAPAADLVEVHFRHPPVGPVEAYVEHFGCPVHFDSFGAALVLRSEVLARPIQHADPVLSRSLIATLDRRIVGGDDGLGQLRREVALHARPAQYSAAAIAGRMGKSLRSLQREAAGFGTTLSQIIDDVRVARARELLLDDSLSVDEVGFLVDYSERAAFSRAFKRATGETPVEYRRRGAN